MDPINDIPPSFHQDVDRKRMWRRVICLVMGWGWNREDSRCLCVCMYLWQRRVEVWWFEGWEGFLVFVYQSMWYSLVGGWEICKIHDTFLKEESLAFVVYPCVNVHPYEIIVDVDANHVFGSSCTSTIPPKNHKMFCRNSPKPIKLGLYRKQGQDAPLSIYWSILLYCHTSWGMTGVLLTWLRKWSCHHSH